MRFVGGVVVHDGVNDLAGSQGLQSVLDRDDFASGRENRADSNEIELGDPRVAKRELEGCKFLAMPADALGQKNAFACWTHLLSTLNSISSFK